MSWYTKRPPAPAPMDVAAFQMVAKAPVLNPGDMEQITFGEYRLDAIARDMEQRKADGRERHQDHDMMYAEAMAYAYMLLAAKRWTRTHVRMFEARLEAAS